MAGFHPTAVSDLEMHETGQRAIAMLGEIGVEMPVDSFYSAGAPVVRYEDMTREKDEGVDVDTFRGRITLGAGLLASGQSPFPVDPVHLTLVRWGEKPDQCGKIRVAASSNLSGGAVVSYVGVTVEDDVLFGPNVVMMDCDGSPVDTSRPATPDNLFMAPVTIGKHAWIGWNAVIMPGVTVGHDATVAAMSVVTKDVPPHSLVMGNPARLVTRFKPRM